MPGFEGHDSPDVARIFNCPHCQVRVYPAAEWKRMTTEQRRASGGRAGVGSMCSNCYANPSSRDPEPGSDYVEPVCKGCDKAMVTQGQWRRANAAEREELLADGYAVSHDSKQCQRCHRAAKGTAPIVPGDMSDRIRRGLQRDFQADYRAAIATGVTTMKEAADLLDLRPDTLTRKVRELRARGVDLPTPRRNS